MARYEYEIERATVSNESGTEEIEHLLEKRARKGWRLKGCYPDDHYEIEGYYGVCRHPRSCSYRVCFIFERRVIEREQSGYDNEED